MHLLFVSMGFLRTPVRSACCLIFAPPSIWAAKYSNTLQWVGLLPFWCRCGQLSGFPQAVEHITDDSNNTSAAILSTAKVLKLLKSYLKYLILNSNLEVPVAATSENIIMTPVLLMEKQCLRVGLGPVQKC